MKIKNEGDFIKADTKFNLKKIDAFEIEVVDVDEYYDGALCGPCRWNNEDFYFYSFDQLEDDGSGDRWPRKYLLLTLTPEQEINNVDKSQQVISPSQLIGWFESDNLVRDN